MLPVAGRSDSPYPARSNGGYAMRRVQLWVVPVVAVVALGVGLLVGAVGGYLLTPRPAVQPPNNGEQFGPAIQPKGPKQFDKGPHTSAEWQTLLLAKTGAEVKEIMGPPNTVFTVDENTSEWTYLGVELVGKNRTTVIPLVLKIRGNVVIWVGA